MLIRRETLAAALPAVSDDDTRFYLSKIQIRPDGQVRSTNGHVAILATDRRPLDDADFPLVPGAEFHGTPDAPVLLDASTAKRLIGATAKGKRSIEVLRTIQISRNGSPDTATIAATDLSAPMVTTVTRKDDERFPELDRVVPAADKPGTVALYLASDVLETLLKAAKAIQGDKRTQTMRFDIPIGRKDRRIVPGDVDRDTDKKTADRLAEITSAIRVTMTGDAVDVIAVAMPCRA